MDITTQLAAFRPADSQEEMVLREVRNAWDTAPDALLRRDSPAHFTVSALILDPTQTQILMVHHNLFQTWTWVGGHTEPGEDLLSAALREAREETGAERIWPLCSQILALDILPVPAHMKNGSPIPEHTHYSAAFGLIAPKNQPLQSKDGENTAVAWIPVEQLPDYCQEPHMLPIYQKIYTRMQAAAQAKQSALARLPSVLLPWYRQNARELPWRADQEPYHVWLSEIMLQQTRVEAVRGYYQRFLAAFPSIQALAEADEAQVLKLWEGLGYYSRARNLQKAARMIMTEYGGQFPREHTAILGLPGVGSYTAGAVASICFGQPEPAVDGNVIRVISRLLELYTPAEQLKTDLIPLLQAIYPAGQCGDFTQSLMELGATVCVPKDKPKCDFCPAGEFCLARASRTASLLPQKAPKKARRIEKKTVFCLTCQDSLAVRRRPGTGLLAGLWELPNTSAPLTPDQALAAAADWGCQPRDLLKSVSRVHIFTHIEWHMTCYFIACGAQAPAFIWAKKEQLDTEIALPTAFKLFLN